MEVLVGPSFSIEVASSSAYVRDRSGVPPPQDMLCAAVGCSLEEEAPEDGVDATWNCFKSGFGSFGSGKGREEVDYHSDSSSSIGVPDDDSDGDSVSSTADGDGEEVHGKLNGGFVSLGSLEESLPIKRGLSNHFSGKSQSFANLAEANSVKDIEKPENPFNKRRRILIASKWARRSSFYSWPNPKSMPLLALKEEDGVDEDEEEESQAPFSSQDKEVDENEDEEEEPKGKRLSDFHRRRLMSFKSRSCCSLADLHQHHAQQQEQ